MTGCGWGLGEVNACSCTRSSAVPALVTVLSTHHQAVTGGIGCVRVESGAGLRKQSVELCLTPPYAPGPTPIEAQFGPLRTFTISNSDHPNHTVLAHRTQDYLRWRNTHTRHPDILAAQRRERA